MSTKKKTIAVSGGFDPVHIGHVRMIQGAAEQGDVWVIINSDPWLMRKKGYVFMPWEERAEIMAALKGVTKISHVNDDDGTVCEALERLQPDAFANGGDRKTNNTPEMDVCERLGIEMLWNVGGGKIQSSSELVAKSLEEQMSLLERCQKRFERATEKEHWKRLKTLLFSEDKESVVQGMSLIEQLDEEVYYDGICTFLEDDGKGNWWLSTELDCQNDLALKVEILRMAQENVGHEIKEVFEKGCLDRMFLKAFENIETEVLEEYEKERLLSKVGAMVEVKREEGRFLVMKYQVTQAMWESVTGSNPSYFKGASLPVEKVSWLDCVIFTNQLSEKEGLEKVYELPEGMEDACKNQVVDWSIDERDIDKYASKVKVNESANGYRLPTEAEWEYAAKGGEDYKYAGSNNVSEVAWYGYSDKDDKNRTITKKETKPVGQKKANGYGLYDMSGNVFEWCFDEHPDDSSCRVRRGGSWNNDAYFCKVSYRSRYYSSVRIGRIGVRLFRSVPQDS